MNVNTAVVSRRAFLRGMMAGAASLLAGGSLKAADAPATKRPNIILFLCDDMGYRDPACFGGGLVATPNLDRLAAEGMKLTRFYAASAVCTPTRASIMTGKYPLRFDIQKVFSDTGQYLPLGPTLPKILKQAGYRTAHVGKWHLGGVRLKDCAMRDQSPGPREQGFEHYLTQIEQQPLRGEMGKERTLHRKGGTCLLRDDKPVGKDDPLYPMHFTDLIAEESLRLIRRFQGEGKPFFLNVWWLVPHQPYEPAPEPFWSQTAAPGISDDQHRFRSMVAHMDHQAGRMLALLRELKIDEETLILFTSDNGGAFEANNGELKGGKTDLHEGGIRVPFIARWPGRIKPGTESAAPAISTDLLPTCCAAAGASLPAGEPLDGASLLELLCGKVEKMPERTLLWQMGLYPSMQRHTPKPKPYATEAARRGRWKLLAMNGKPVELFDLEADPREEKNMLTQKPEIVQSLRKEVEAFLAAPRRPFGVISPDTRGKGE